MQQGASSPLGPQHQAKHMPHKTRMYQRAFSFEGGVVMNWTSVSPQNLYVEVLTLLWWYKEVGPLEDDQVMRMQPSWMGLVPFCKWGPRDLACSLSTMWGHRRKWPSAAWKRPPGPSHTGTLRTGLQTPDLWEINVCSSLCSFCSIFYNTLTKTGGKKGKEILNEKYHGRQ